MSDAPTEYGTKLGDLQRRFLQEWVRIGFVAACDAVGICRETPAKWTEADPAFASERERVEQAIADGHEATLDRIAAGIEPGSAVQLKAIELRLRALRPHRYRDSAQRVELTGANGGAVRVEDGNASRALEFLARYAATRRVDASAASGALPPPPDDADASVGIVEAPA